MNLIDKDVLVAEIYRLRDFANDRWNIEEMNGVDKFLDKLIPYINSLEVKEVDLEKELEDWLGERVGKWTGKECERMCRHFFELGLKAQKGE